MLWIGVSFVLCPCHLPITLGLGAVLLAGTAAGAFLRDNTLAAGMLVTVAWAAGTGRGLFLIRSARNGSERSSAGRTEDRTWG